MLTWIHLLPANVVLFGLAAIAATLFGVAAMWAVGGRAGWLARTAPVALLLAALVPIGAYELLAVFGAQVAVVIAWVLVVRLGRAFRDSRNQGESRRGALRTALRREWGDRARFHLRDVLLAVLLAGVVLAIVRLAEPMRTGLGLLPPVSGVYGAVGTVLGILTVAIEWAIFGRARLYLRMPVLLLVLAGLCGELYWGIGLNGVATVASGAVTATLMAMTRTAGWAPWRSPGEDRQPMPKSGEDKPTRRWLRWLAQFAMCVMAVAAVAVLIPAYRVLLPAKSPSAVTLPSPNGYDELVQAAKSINWSAIPSRDDDAASIAASRTFVHDNADSLTLVREALAKPSRVPIVDNAPYDIPTPYDISILRDLSRSLRIEARLAEAERRHADAVDIYLDIVRVGDTASRGGLLFHEFVGIALESIGLHGIEPLVAQLNGADLATLSRKLQESDAAQQSIEQIFERADAFGSANYDWVYRLLMALDHPLVAPAYGAATTARHRSEAHLRLILAEAALRQYVLQNGALPESLAALVPEYLSKVPQDPFGDGPLVYRTTDDGYVLYSVGSNGIDDGGQRTSFVAATVEGKGDLFFDTSGE